MFAYTVADVLDEQVGDLIVVPREFTAQTGSDFDVDKIYLSNRSYVNGKLATDMSTRDGVINKLLDNYTQLITDVKTYSDARASIDTVTKKINNELLDMYLREKRMGYLDGMTELLPSFQALRKMEFGVGKTGIGPFALNVTNLALTQYAHLTMDYGPNNKEGYNFGDLDESTGKDGIRISAWLSAMVNAHVDVAKDAYVFDLNVNQLTYNHTNFLLRAGMGISTFHFLAQPILKQFANIMNSSGGMYAGDPEVRNGEASSDRSKSKIATKLYKQYVQMLEESGDTSEIVKNAINYFKSKYDSQLKRQLKDTNSVPYRPIAKSFMF